MVNKIFTESVKKVVTFDSSGNKNGFLIELFKDGDNTEVYLSAAVSGAFKGYHLHRVRAARYVCLKGKMKIILYIPQKVKSKLRYKREEYILDGDKPRRLFIPRNVATGLQNIGEEDAWLVNYPDPPYDPSLKDEQVEYTQEELEKGITK